MFNSAIFSIHGMDGHTRVHLEGSSGGKVQNPKELPGQVFTQHFGNTTDCLLITLIIEFTFARIENGNVTNGKLTDRCAGSSPVQLGDIVRDSAAKSMLNFKRWI